MELDKLTCTAVKFVTDRDQLCWSWSVIS